VCWGEQSPAAGATPFDDCVVHARYVVAFAAAAVGGITADWVRYTPDAPASSPAASTKDTIGVADYVSAMTTSPRLGGFWPTEPQNLTYADFDTLLGFFSATGMKLLFDLNELYGRNCNTTQPGCPSCPDWCVQQRRIHHFVRMRAQLCMMPTVRRAHLCRAVLRCVVLMQVHRRVGHQQRARISAAPARRRLLRGQLAAGAYTCMHRSGRVDFSAALRTPPHRSLRLLAPVVPRVG